MPRKPYEAAVRLRLPNGRPATAKTASTSAVHGRNHVVAPNALADVFLSATCFLSALGFGRGKVGDAKQNCVESEKLGRRIDEKAQAGRVAELVERVFGLDSFSDLVCRST